MNTEDTREARALLEASAEGRSLWRALERVAQSEAERERERLKFLGRMSEAT